MKKWFYNLPVKALALILATLCLFSAVISGFGIGMLLYRDGYRSTTGEVEQDYLRMRFDFLPEHLLELYQQRESYFAGHLAFMELDVEFWCMLEENNRLLFSNYSGQDHTVSIRDTFYVGFPDATGSENTYCVSVWLGEVKEGSDLETELSVLRFFSQARYGLIAVFATCTPAFLLLCIFLCFAAGKRGAGEARDNFFHRIPIEIYLIGGFCVALAEGWFLEMAPQQTWFRFLCLALYLLADGFLLLIFLMSFAVRCKQGTLLSASFVGKLWGLLRRVFGVIPRLWQDIRLVPKLAVVMAILALFDLFLASVLDFTECLAAFLIEGIVLTAVLIWYAAAIQRLEKDAEELAEGRLEIRSDLSRLPAGLRPFGEKLNRSARGMEKAVEEKLKSERFKTELITNVSHDIKTPLTSIVNFVDLMKKEEIENERVREYLEVLDRQSSRLKKLTEDLVESSKAASGVLPVELQRCDAGVLLEQAMGEYQLQLEEKGLVPCLSLPEEPVYIMADGKRLWRVMDNLFCNIVKYSLTGTRVYVSLEEREGKAELVFRNISAQPISLGGEHLTERFVRGDLSRNTEGSGLGLAIAQSLTELQKGKLSVTVDGDLFKAVIRFDRV